MKNSTKFLLFVGAVLIVVAVMFRFSLFDYLTIDHFVPWVERYRTNPWFTLAFYCFFVFGVMALPITIFPIIGGILLPFWVALPLNVFCATLGGWFSMWTTRLFGRGLVEGFLKGKLKSLDRITSSEGFKAVLVLRLIGVPPFIVTNYAMGFSAVRTKDFWIGTLLGILPWMTIVTFASHSLWQAVLLGGQKGLMKALGHLIGPLLIISLSMATSFIIADKMKKKRVGKAERATD